MVCLSNMAARKFSRPPARAALVKAVTAALDDMKAVNVKVLDVREVTDISDCMVVASGNSDRHVRSIADRVVERARAGGFRPIGVEGQRDGEWVLVDLNDVLVHVMLPRVREFYGLEELWEAPRAVAKVRAGSKTGAKTGAGAAKRSPTRKGKGKASPARAKAKAGAPRAKSKAPASGARTRTTAPAARSSRPARRGARSRA
jgi:ribosome-associated protein